MLKTKLDRAATCWIGLALLAALLGLGAGTARAASVRFAAPGDSGAQPCLESAPCDSEKALTGSVADGDSIVPPAGDLSPE